VVSAGPGHTVWVDKDKRQDKPVNNMSTQTVCPGPALPTSSQSPAHYHFEGVKGSQPLHQSEDGVDLAMIKTCE
jgi:hypothetical protein